MAAVAGYLPQSSPLIDLSGDGLHSGENWRRRSKAATTVQITDWPFTLVCCHMTADDRCSADQQDAEPPTLPPREQSENPTVLPARDGTETEHAGDAGFVDDATLPPTEEAPRRAASLVANTGRIVGDYELLEEIARGGMGVVYKARHRKLNRLVALKLVLAGQFASAEDITRFHIEAEAAAGLDHSGITPIYEIGDCDGQPFFAMKLIAGGSVEGSIGFFEQNPREAVAMLSKVARAIHHAHERGVLHRDLKPSNILLDDERQPLVTDFGLAKIADRDSEHTRTGAIMGTPAYMAPEQAAGGKGVTTASDIYGIGAILYRLLTGRPTYVAGSALDVVMKSLTDDPEAPRSINPEVPLDLELICMKCLARDPLQRYNSAAALADDLDRWLAGEVVSVRPASMGTLAGIWMKQNMQMAGSASLVGSIFGVLLAAFMYIAMYSVNFAFVADTYAQYFPSVERPWLAVNLKAPEWGFITLLFGWPTLIALCGLVTVLVTKPTTRRATASVGMIAGVFCCGIMGMVGVLGPIMSQTVVRTEHDVRLLVQAAETDPDRNRFAQLAIVQTYPDMERFNEADRAALLRRKISSDLIVGIPTGLWLGMTVFMTGVPAIVMGSIFAWRLTQRVSNVWMVWYRYLDVAIAFCILLTFVILFVAVRPLGAELYVPPVAQTVLILLLLLLALVAATVPWPWYYRLPVHLAWMSCILIYLQQSLAAPNAYLQAGPAVLAGEYQRALEDVEDSLSVRSEDPWLLLLAGTLQAKLELPEEYHETCEQILTAAVALTAPEQADRAAKLCLLSQRKLEPSALAVQLAEKALVLGKHSDGRPWFQMVHAMAQYRCGLWQETIETVAQIDGRRSFIVSCTADIVKAMALQQLDDDEQAKQVYTQSTRRFDQAWQASTTDEFRRSNWHDMLIYQIWRDQANKQLR